MKRRHIVIEPTLDPLAEQLAALRRDVLGTFDRWRRALARMPDDHIIHPCPPEWGQYRRPERPDIITIDRGRGRT